MYLLQYCIVYHLNPSFDYIESFILFVLGLKYPTASLNEGMLSKFS